MSLDPALKLVKANYSKEGHPGYYGKGAGTSKRSQGTHPHHKSKPRTHRRHSAKNKFGGRNKGKK